MVRDYSYLHAASSVLRSTAGNQDGVAGQKVFVDAEMLVLVGENGIVGLEIIFLEQVLAISFPSVCMFLPNGSAMQ